MEWMYDDNNREDYVLWLIVEKGYSKDMAEDIADFMGFNKAE